MTTFLHPTYLLAILIAISVHEWAHAVTATRLGDPTPEAAGRLTLNPIAHIDLLGALMFLVVGFGWAKPVPVNPSYFHHPKRGMALTAIAGPLSNLCLATLAFLGLLLLGGGAASVDDLIGGPVGVSAGKAVLGQFLGSSLFVNMALMAFNLFPIAPLDGSNILRLFVPYHLEDQYEDVMHYGSFILLALILFEPALPFQPLSGWVHGIMGAVLAVFQFVSSVVV